MNVQDSKIFLIVILYFIGKVSFTSAFLSSDIIVPPKLSDRTTPKVLIPSPVPTDMKPTTSIFDSIVKRSTANQFIVPPTIRSSDNVHLNLMVPPTISSSQTGNNAGNGQPSSQVVGILNSQPRVVCYADQPIDRDVPCPGDHNTSLGVQHMQSILKLMGGSDIKHTMVMKDPTVTPSTDLNNDDHSSASPVEQDRLSKLLMEISLQLNQQMLSSLKRNWNDNIPAITNEIITLTDALFKQLFSVYEESYITSIFSNQTSLPSWTNSIENLKSKGWQSLLTEIDTSKDFATNITDYHIINEKIHNFYQALLNVSKQPKDYSDLIRNIQKDIDFTSSKIVYKNIKSAISHLRTIYSLINTTVENATDTSNSSSTSDNSPMRTANQSLVLLNSYVQSYTMYENIQSRPNHTFPATPSEDTTDDAETMVRRVTNFLENRVTILEQLLDEANIDVIQCEENIEKLEKAIPTKRRKRRSIIGTSDVTCQSQGERIGGGNLLNLCSTCVQTTVLNENFFPRYITEKVCQHDLFSPLPIQTPSKQGCLYQPSQGGTSVPAGVCSEQFFHINILKRVPGKCMKVYLDGKEVITDLWELTMHPLRVGCECAVDENSKFAHFVNKF